MTDLENTRPSTLDNKIALLHTSVIVSALLYLIVAVWLSQYIGVLAVVVVSIPFWLYTRWASNKVTEYNWQLNVIDDMKRRGWKRY